MVFDYVYFIFYRSEQKETFHSRILIVDKLYFIYWQINHYWRENDCYNCLLTTVHNYLG